MRIQVYAEDCTGCGVCVSQCPAAAKGALKMEYRLDHAETEDNNLKFFDTLPYKSRTQVEKASIKGSQLIQPLFEFSGSCAGCGETPYVKLVSQLFGDRMVVANATGCSSIYGGNLPSTPWAKDENGHGPAWANSLFEDNAEFGLGIRLSLDQRRDFAIDLVKKLSADIGDELATRLVSGEQKTDADFDRVRTDIAALKTKLAGIQNDDARRLETLADSLLKRSLWIMGGDGWAYDIGYAGLDHIFSLGRNVNSLSAMWAIKLHSTTHFSLSQSYLKFRNSMEKSAQKTSRRRHRQKKGIEPHGQIPFQNLNMRKIFTVSLIIGFFSKTIHNGLDG